MKNKLLCTVLSACFLNTSCAERINIFFASDNNFAEPTGVAIASILCNADHDDDIYVYIIDDNISEKNKKKINNLSKIKKFNIEYIPMTSESIKSLPMTEEQKNRFGGFATYYRYLVPFVKTDIDKAIYLDGDIVVLRSLKNLWKTDISNHMLAAVKCMSGRKYYTDALFSVDGESPNGCEYFNAGILVVNCKKFREKNMFDVLLKESGRLSKLTEFLYPDQDTLNYVCRNDVKVLPLRYNMSPYIAIFPDFNYCLNNLELISDCELKVSYKIKESTFYRELLSKALEYFDEIRNLTIFHYSVKEKPWKFESRVPMQKYYFKYLRKTEFYDMKNMLFDAYVHIRDIFS